MTPPSTPVGRPTDGKVVNLAQLQNELALVGVQTTGLGKNGDYVHTYDAGGSPAEFPVDDQPTVDQVIANHLAMRPKTSAEYATEFQDPNTTPARKQEIRDIQNALLPPEMVPMTTEDMP